MPKWEKKKKKKDIKSLTKVKDWREAIQHFPLQSMTKAFWDLNSNILYFLLLTWKCKHQNRTLAEGEVGCREDKNITHYVSYLTYSAALSSNLKQKPVLSGYCLPWSLLLHEKKHLSEVIACISFSSAVFLSFRCCGKENHLRGIDTESRMSSYDHRYWRNAIYMDIFHYMPLFRQEV